MATLTGISLQHMSWYKPVSSCCQAEREIVAYVLKYPIMPWPLTNPLVLEALVEMAYLGHSVD